MRRWKRLREMCCKPSTDGIPWQWSTWNSLSGHIAYCYCQQKDMEAKKPIHHLQIPYGQVPRRLLCLAALASRRADEQTSR